MKKIVFPVISGVLFYNSFKLVNLFADLSPDALSLLAIIVAAIAFNMMLTGAFAFPGFEYPTNRLLPQAYYHIKSPEVLLRLYRTMGVKYFRSLLLLTFYRNEDNKKYFNGTKAGLKDFEYHTRQSEFGHLGAFVLIAGVSLLLYSYGHAATGAWAMGINVFFNFYPIILQRKHRIQLERLMQRGR